MMKNTYSLSGKRIWVAGHTGLVGSALCQRLSQEGCEILTISHSELDLTRQQETEDWISTHNPDAIIIAAATVGGIYANNTRPAEFIFNNLAIETNIINAAYKASVQKLLFLGSNCAYPREASQPIQEDALLTGPLEPTNEWFAIAKIAGIKLCQAYRKQYGVDYISVMPTNLYGPNDNFDFNSSHVIPALIQKAHLAKATNQPSIEIWGSGKPIREFMYIDDFADSLIFILKNYSDSNLLNISTGQEITIEQLVQKVVKIVNFHGIINYDSSKPDGISKKTLDSKTLDKLGWFASTSLEQGLKKTYEWYLNRFNLN